MTDQSKLILVKLVHTVAWVFFASAILYVFYSGVSGNISSLTWVCVGLTLLEAAILLSYRWACPLTIIARKYSDSDRDNFDIYLPDWLAKHNKTIFTTIFLLGMLLILVRFLID